MKKKELLHYLIKNGCHLEHEGEKAYTILQSNN